MGDKPAFPVLSETGRAYAHAHHGLTRRELFAALAMQAEISCQGREGATWWDFEDGGEDASLLARKSVLFADALISELDK